MNVARVGTKCKYCTARIEAVPGKPNQTMCARRKHWFINPDGPPVKGRGI